MNQLGIFAKYWSAGQVKTRLARDVGADQAAELYRVMLLGLSQRFERLGERRILSIWPPESREKFEEAFGHAWKITLQANGDLGARMGSYFQDAFARARRRSF